MALGKRSLLFLSFSNGNASASHRTDNVVALCALLMKKEKTSMVATSVKDRSRLREQKQVEAIKVVLRVICEHFFGLYYIEFLVRSCLKRTWCKHVHFRPLLHRPALKTKTAQRAKSRNKFSIATKDNQVSNNNNAHNDDDAPTNNFSPSQNQ